MNKFLLCAAASAASLSISAANATPVASSAVNTFSVQEVNARTLQPDAVSRRAYREFLGMYDLDNGASLRLSPVA